MSSRRLFMVWVMALVFGLGCSEVPSVGSSILEKRLIVQKPLFVIKHKAFSHVLVEPPGHTDHAPPSIEIYQRNPSGWMNTPEARRAEITASPADVEVLGILLPGTVVVVTDFAVTTSFVREIYAPLGSIEDERFSGVQVEFFCLFEGLGGAHPDPRSRDEFLRKADQ